ncbi:hypothetical protein WA026_019515 [Henosepilachna vigintioctopunctata]|uniref:Uncharacterized protein n=1 Tax=Henosepilachna vigintioctopunctata TaxID=420089 RepID=A0AAW1TPI4_9CUCU
MFMKSRNMVKITPYDIAGLFNKAYARVASLDKGISGFKATGIYPINPAIFSEDDFVAVDGDQSQANDQASSDVVVQFQRPTSIRLVTGNSDPLPCTSRDIGHFELLPSTSPGTGNYEPLPSTSRGIQHELEMPSSDLIEYTQNVEKEQLPDIYHAVSPSILSELQEEASIANTTPNFSTNTKASIIIPFSLNDKTAPELTPANTSTTLATTNDVQEQSLCTNPTTSNDFAKVLSVVSPLPNISNKNKTLRKQHSVILSSTPMKTVFEEKDKKRLEKKCKTKIIAKKKGETSKKERICTAGKAKKRKDANNKNEKVKE